MYRIFQPAIFVMNKLSYKIKIFILASISILSFSYPAYSVFNTIIFQEKRYNVQMYGLEYYKRFYTLLESISQQNSILDKKNSYQEVTRKDKNIDILLKELTRFDSMNLNIISNELDLLKNSPELSEDLIVVFENLSFYTYFNRSKDQYLHHLTTLLHKQLYLMKVLHEAQLLGDNIFSKNYMLPDEKVAFTKIYTQLHELLKGYSLKNGNDILNEQQSKLYAFADILNDNIIKKYNSGYDQSLFNQKLSIAINTQVELHDKLLDQYNNRVIQILENTKENENTFIWIILSILFLYFYIYIAFYKAVTGSLSRLQNASWLVARGDFKNQEAFVETKDEVGDLFLAFNQMQNNLTKNIAFLNSYKMSIDQSSIVSKTDKKGVITYINKKFCDISGYSADELIGKSHNVIRHPDVPKEAFKDLWATIQSGKIWHGIVKNRKKNGDYYIVDATVAPILDENGEIEEYIAVRHDVTELEKSKEKLRKQKEEELHIQETDLLTQLPNRVRMIKDLKNSQDKALVFLNISSFGKLNEFYGTDVGDKVLITLSKVLQENVKDDKISLYKMHAAEFAFVLEIESYSKNDVENFTLQTIQKIEEKKIYCQNDNCITLSLVAGISYESETFEEIFSHADMALKRAKKSNKNMLFYDESMKKDSNYENNMIWIEKIKKAISEDKILPYFQPIVNNSTEAINKYEALVRLIDDEDKVISPFFFLDIAKGAKLYSQITKIVIEKSFKMFDNLPYYEFSINLSMEDVLDKDTVEFIIDKLDNYAYPNRVIFEIVESEEISDYELLTAFIKRVKSYGSQIAIDDFGTGYSNFEHILTLDADFIKIDGSLIKNIDSDENARIITSAIIAFSKELNKKTIVEFVHNEEIYNKVREMGADYSQGYYLGEPRERPLMIEEQTEDLLEEPEFMI